MSENEPRGPVYLSEDRIQARVAELAEAITRDYAGRTPHLIAVLNGAFIFMADLVRRIELPLTLDFMAVASYQGTESSGEVELIKDLSQPIGGRDVIVVEDIVDTGITLEYLLDYLHARKPASLKVAALLSKPARRLREVPVDYLGFEIENAYVYGYGLDRDQLDRNLPYITSLPAG
ncbi:hypoxanthine phosphoribosyltransferase [Oceanithermus desulfurans]|uniref:Hypoxanthine phosphoribosyltransferase n=2 Tax=Oceanithermus desulfurans TaxID=227924 RepID=A0A511RNU9_9DEIN|nr:hypoxanthine phosphoribosyltransferase [Oceanithermus desulfurans]MBB6030948.1 hypoxanthine phosphoribosyltransferase [Oceanithermus desulfurans]GEM90757.1 hypoxanthine phosphoribosyltransferase [Oceanithermus desulfurans NBRC 100063]